jgi:branched-chain amino acid aminotransferase
MITGKIPGRHYIINGKSADAEGYAPDMSAEIYYEVIRMIDRKFLFLEDHLERLKNSVSGSGLEFPGNEVIKDHLRLLQTNNDEVLGNIRICLQANSGNKPDLICYFVPYYYPDECMYKSGVQLVTYPHERPNPVIKKWDNRFRVKVNDFIRDHGVYEAILMNFQHQITEGSRSNIFFIDRDNILYTAPTEDVLPGITRKYVLTICNEEKIRVVERSILKDELSEMSACFISGTSPKILPIWQLDGTQFSVDHPLLKLFMERFEAIVKENLVSLLVGTSG